MRNFIKNHESKNIYNERYLNKHYKDIYNEILSYINDNSLSNFNWKEKMYCYMNNLIKLPKCENPYCDNNTYCESVEKGFRKHCCIKCTNNKDNSVIIEKDKSINIFYQPDPSGKLSKENLVKMNYPDHYNTIMNYAKENNIDMYDWKIIKHCFVNNLTEVPKCTNKNCNNDVSYIKKEFNKFCSKECRSTSKEIYEIAKKTNLERYGVEHYSKTNESKERIKKTNLERYGVDSYTKTKECQDKMKEANLKKYGVENYTQSSEYLEKSIKTSLEKYGETHYSKTKEYKQRVQNTSLDKYGVDNYAKTEECKDKMKNTNLNKYDVDHYSKTNEYRKKYKKTSLEKYGFDSPMKSDTIKEKLKNAFVEKYGVDNINKYEDYRKEKFNISKNINYIEYLGDGDSKFKCDCGCNHEFIINNNQYQHRYRHNNKLCTVCYPIGEHKSIKEKELSSYIMSIYDGDIICSYRDGLEIDIFLPELNIGIEFNGIYWHSDKFLDKDYHLNKKNFFKEKGINIIYIWEDDWLNNNDIIKAKIYDLLNVNSEISYDIIHAINNNIVELSINGNTSPIVKFNLIDNIWYMSEPNSINYNYIKAIIEYFIEKYSPSKIITYISNDWEYNEIYEKLNFILVESIEPQYKYLFKGNRVDENFSEMKVYDSGLLKYERII